MTIYLDTSALVSVVINILERNAQRCSSALSIGEAMAIVGRLAEKEILQNDLKGAMRLIWDRMVVPIDQTCSDRAALLTREHPAKIIVANDPATTDRLSQPLKLITFDPAQISVSLSLDFNVVST